VIDAPVGNVLLVAYALAMNAEKLLILLLRIKALILGSAVIAVFLPYSSMDDIHRWLQLGPLPQEPIVGYMARSLSALYASHGALALLTSFDVRRFLPFVKYQGWFAITLGVLILGIDLKENIPTWWTSVEAPWILLTGTLLLWLANRLPVSSPGERH
jgi:hypothetical protein